LRPRLIALIVSLGVVVAGTAAAYAAVLDSNGVIHGCYTTAANRNGDHLLFVTDNSCPAGSTALNWNQQGPKGAPGPAGPQGLQGPAGPSPTTYMKVHVTPANTSTLYEVFCDFNLASNRLDTAVAGGANYQSSGEAVGISGSVPIGEHGGQQSGDRPVGWHVDYAMYTPDPTLPNGIRGVGAPGQVNIWVICQK
jgi:hypothetical protein